MKTKLAALIILALLSSGCVYKIDIQQGNEITEEMVAKLETGMTQREVTRILGYPLINDPFHKDRWDYFYSKKEGKTGQVTKESVTLTFADGLLSSIETTFTE